MKVGELNTGCKVFLVHNNGVIAESKVYRKANGYVYVADAFPNEDKKHRFPLDRNIPAYSASADGLSSVQIYTDLNSAQVAVSREINRRKLSKCASNLYNLSQSLGMGSDRHHEYDFDIKLLDTLELTIEEIKSHKGKPKP